MGGEYLVTVTTTYIVDALTAAQARKLVEDAYYVKPGFDRDVHRTRQVQGIKVEKRRD